MNNKNSDIIITSGYNIEGYRITKYIDHVSAVAVLGTGIFSGLNASISDLFGTRSSMYEDKLSKAKDMAICELKNRAKAIGANAIIGLDVDYTTFSADIIGVAVGGTAVTYAGADRLQYKELYIYNYDISLPFNISCLAYRPVDSGKSEILLKGKVYEEKHLTALAVNIDLRTIFNDNIDALPVIFPDITINPDRIFITSPVLTQNDATLFDTVKKAYVHVAKYISDENIITSDGKLEQFINMTKQEIENLRYSLNIDAVRENSVTPIVWECCCGHDNSPDSASCSRCHRLNSKGTKIISTDTFLPPIVTENGMWECPCCGKLQQPREKCWSCGNTFYTEKN